MFLKKGCDKNVFLFVVCESFLRTPPTVFTHSSVRLFQAQARAQNYLRNAAQQTKSLWLRGLRVRASRGCNCDRLWTLE